MVAKAQRECIFSKQWKQLNPGILIAEPRLGEVLKKKPMLCVGLKPRGSLWGRGLTSTLEAQAVEASPGTEPEWGEYRQLLNLKANELPN